MLENIKRINSMLRNSLQPLSKDAMLFPCGMSRSGTTLLTTILDSHSQVSLGYELIPPKVPDPVTLKELLEKGLTLSGGSFEKCGKALRSAGENDVGLFFKRCHRASVSLAELREVLDELEKEGYREISTLRERLGIAWKITLRKKLKENSFISGFKLNISSFEEAYKLFPGGYFIYIIRDPRDVVDSHIERGFKKTPEEICFSWNQYIKKFDEFQKKYSSISLVIKYEDLVDNPRLTIHNIFDILPIKIEQNVFEFYNSKASVHNSNHPNSANLRRDFFTTSVGRWRNGLDEKTAKKVTDLCKDKMVAYNYV
ncbi:MAG: sulfotransferase [Coleofasciculus sp.]